MPIELQDSIDDSFAPGTGFARPDLPSARESFKAGFELENDIVAGIDLLTRPTHKPDPEFNFLERLRKSPFYLTHSDTFVGAESEDEFAEIERRIGHELKQRQVMASNGTAGMAGAMLGGVVSPTIFLPIAGAGRGARGIASAFGYAALGGVAQESMLLSAQETRTMGEAGLSIATQTVLGGLLGSASVYMRNIDEVAAGMDETPGVMTILPAEGLGSGPTARSVGAQERGVDVEGAGRLKFGDRKDISTLSHVGPVTRAINNKTFGAHSAEMAKLDTAGVQLEGFGHGRVAREGGTVKDRITAWDGTKARVLRKNDEAYANFVLKGAAHNRMKANILNFIPGGTRVAGIMSRTEWNKRVADAINEIPDREIIPEIEAMAKEYRKFFDEVSTEAVNLGMYKGVTDLEDFVTKGEIGYLHRVYNTERISQRMTEWLGILSAHVNKKLTKQYKERAEKLTKSDKLSEQDIEDLARPREEAEQMIEEIKKQLDETQGANVFQELEDQISDLQRQLRETKPGSPERAALKDQIKAMKRGGGEEFEQMRADRGALRRRLRTLRRGRGNLERRQQEALERIEEIEEKNINALHRAIRAGQKALKKLDKVADENLDEELSNLRTRFEQAARTWERGEERIQKLVKERDLEAEAAVNAPKSPSEVKVTKVSNDIFESDTHRATIDRRGGTPQQNEADKYFRKEALDDLRNQGSSSRTTLVYMTPDEFLSVAQQTAGDAAKLDKVREVVDSGTPLEDIPYLSFENMGSGSARVTGHEGRHRVMVLKELGVKQIPVRFHSMEGGAGGIRWGKQAHKGRDQIEGDWPTVLHGQENNNTVPFPIGDLRQGATLPADAKPTKNVTIRVFAREGLGPTGERVQEFQVPAKGASEEAQRILKERSASPELGDAEAVQARVEEAASRQEIRESKLDELAERIERGEAFDRDEARALIQEGLDDALKKINGVNSRRAVREAKAKEKLQKLDPARAEEEIARIRERQGMRHENLTESLRRAGVGDYELEKGEFDFSDASMALAQDITNHILKADRSRLSGVDMMIGTERGALLARHLDVPIDAPGFREYLERDVEVVSRAFMRTMGPDIEMFRATGSVNGSTAIDRMNQEFRLRQDQILQDIGQDGKPLAKPRTQEQKDKLLDKLLQEHNSLKRDYEVVVARLRHQRGVPSDAASLGFRMGKVALDLNVLRLMGTVLPSSVADVGRPVMKYSLQRTFRDGWLPLITNWQQVARQADLARFSGTGNDALNHTRSQHLFDIIDDYQRGTMFEKGLQFLSNRMGLVAIFDQWTQAQKFVTAGPVNSMIWDSIESIVTGSSKYITPQKAQEFLDSVGITGRLADNMWRLANEPGGSVRGNRGVILPNAEDWVGEGAREAQWAYRSAMNRAIDDTIITPGPERPNWVDENMAFRVVAQFRSFAFSSTTKTMIAGLQQRDMALVNGALISLAMGALSYYIWALSTGGRAYEEMLEAGPDRWADEAIDRSGLLAVFGEARRMAERIPIMSDFTTFSGQRTTRRAGEDLVAAVLGPSFDLGKRISNVIMGLDDPTASTIHNMRLLTPFQNVFWLRQALDAVEKGTVETLGIPERRQ